MLLWRVAVLATAACGSGEHDEASPWATRYEAPVESGDEWPVEPHSPALECSDCHPEEHETNPKRRVLTEEHTDIVLRHDERHRWCLDCHDPDDRERLRLASGERVDFHHSYRLCGQCHGDKYRDWRAGVHGRRTGSWTGRGAGRTGVVCVHCHDPHTPRFRLKDGHRKPPPRRPLPPE